MKTSTPTKQHWLDIAEITAVTGSIGGSIASIFLKQYLWVTIPLSVSAGLAVVNHKRLHRLLKSEQEAIAMLVQEDRAKLTKLKEQSEKQHWDSTVEITDLKKTAKTTTSELERVDREQQTKLTNAAQEIQILQTSMDKLDELTKKLEHEQNETRKLAGELKAIEKFTQMINNNPDSAQAYYHRGSAYQRSGNKERAIQDFSQAIALSKDHAKAHHKRGLLYLEIDEAQKAIIDFRKASQYYISQGDLEKYRETRDLSLKIHFSQSTEDSKSESDPQPKAESYSVAVNSAFG